MARRANDLHSRAYSAESVHDDRVDDVFGGRVLLRRAGSWPATRDAPGPPTLRSVWVLRLHPRRQAQGEVRDVSWEHAAAGHARRGTARRASHTAPREGRTGCFARRDGHACAQPGIADCYFRAYNARAADTADKRLDRIAGPCEAHSVGRNHPPSRVSLPCPSPVNTAQSDRPKPEGPSCVDERTPKVWRFRSTRRSPIPGWGAPGNNRLTTCPDETPAPKGSRGFVVLGL